MFQAQNKQALSPTGINLDTSGLEKKNSVSQAVKTVKTMQ
jgi:hypothetical protein